MTDLGARPRAVPTPPWLRWWLVACIVCVFGPYVVSGIRTEQLAMYASAGVVVATQAPRLWRILAPAAPALAIWGCYAAVAAIAGLVTDNRTPWDSGSLLAGLDNLALPLATIVTVAFWRSRSSGHELLRLASVTVVIAMSANTLVSIWTTYFGTDVPGLRRFWAAGGSDVTVAELSAGNGRFSGVFNQPAEAGIAYSLAAVALLYLVRRGGPARGRHLVAWVLIIIGGLLTLSKVFVVGGLVVAVLMVITDRRNRARMALTGAATAGTMVGATFAGLAGAWGASGMAEWYRASIRAGDSPLYTISAGRFGSAGTDGVVVAVVPPDPDAPVPASLRQVASAVLHEHPVFGLGAQGLQVSYDSTWGETLVTSGLVGLVLILALHAFLVLRTMGLRGRLPSLEWVFAVAVVVLVAGSSFGMPSLTGNREATLVWIFVGLLVLSPDTRPTPTVLDGVRGLVRRRQPTETVSER